MSDYIIEFTAPTTAPHYKTPITVTDGTLNITSTSLKLCGHNYPNYGSILWTNMVHLLENYCSNTYPEHSTRGQTWYDSVNDKLMVHNGTDYVYIEGNDTLTLTMPNLNNLLKNQSPPYFDGRYILRTGDSDVSSLQFTSGANIAMAGDGTLTTQKRAKDGEDVVNRDYIAYLFGELGYDIDNFGTNVSATIYLPLAGGKMKPGANIEFEGSGTVKVNDDAKAGVDVVNKSYADRTYLTYVGPNNGVKAITMSSDGKLTLGADSCDLADDSLQAVPAYWVTKKIKALTTQLGGGSYIPIMATGTAVSNNLTFTKNNWIKVDLDTANWSDDKLVINRGYADTRYVKKTGDSLTSHPFTFTQPATQPTAAEEKLDALNVPTCGWVNHRIQAAAGGSATPTGPTVSKIYNYGPNTTFTGTTTIKAALTSSPVNNTISITLPSNTASITYEIRLGINKVSITGSGMSPEWYFKLKDGVNVIYEDGQFITTEHTYSCKYVAAANVATTLTLEIAHGWWAAGTAIYYPWIIADPLSVATSVASTSTGGGGATVGPVTNGVTYIEYPNGMVTISGMTKGTAPTLISAGLATKTEYMVVPAPFPIPMKVPYQATASIVGTDTSSINVFYNTNVLSLPSHGVGSVTETGCSFAWLIRATSNFPTPAIFKSPTSLDVYWTVSGFKK